MKVIIGSRGSQLALCQAEWVREKLGELYPQGQFVIKEIRTRGDEIPDIALVRMEGKGFFTKEIEEALLRKEIDIAVHSLKDLPTEIPPHLTLGAITVRVAAHDALVSKEGQGLNQLPKGARIGTSSLRRRAQLLKFRPDLRVIELRGNLNTRLRKLKEENLDAIVVAGAGLKRMDREDWLTETIPFDIILPAAGQGSLGIQIRKGEAEIKETVAKLEDKNSRLEMDAERSFLRRLGGGCQVPVGTLAQLKKSTEKRTGSTGESLNLKGIILSLDGQHSVQSELAGRAEDARSLGEKLAEELLARGGEELLRGHFMSEF